MRKRKPLNPNCSSLANDIARAVLAEFKLKYAADHMNYWGIKGEIPSRLTENIDKTLSNGAARKEMT